MPDGMLVLGGGGHAKVVISLVKKLGLEVIGYTDLVDRGELLSAPYLGPDLALLELRRAHPDASAAMGVGKIDTSPARSRLFAEAKEHGFKFPTLVSPRAIVNEEVELGEGTVVFDGAAVNSGSIMGELCIVNTNATVEHDCTVGHNSHIAPGAVIGGGVQLGDDCMIGAGAVVLQGVTMCAGCLVGAGSIVLRDLQEPGVYVGAPARKLR